MLIIGSADGWLGITTNTIDELLAIVGSRHSRVTELNAKCSGSNEAVRSKLTACQIEGGISSVLIPIVSLDQGSVTFRRRQVV